ncbi:hypothetical protein M3Y99_01502300 [Aphelenchoides fujianensis]|nr:hypothetical protein M3Y99_01502300 [Aphelenchoides fujianensis]
MTKPAGSKPKTASKGNNQRPARSGASKQSTSKVRLTGEEVREMRRLSEMLPTSMRSTNPQDDPMLLIHNTTEYINILTSTLLARVQNGSISADVLDHLPIPPATSLSAAFRPRSSKPKGVRKERRGA